MGKLVSLAGGLIRPVAKKQIDHLVDAIKRALDAGQQKKGDPESETAQK
jgi:hypothetical protein